MQTVDIFCKKLFKNNLTIVKHAVKIKKNFTKITLIPGFDNTFPGMPSIPRPDII